jgi:hypothetical protein
VATRIEDFSDVKSSCASPAVRGNRPSPNIPRIAVEWFTRDVVMHLRTVPKLLCTCSIMIGKNTRAARIAENMSDAFACRQIEVAQERRYTHTETLKTTE